MTESPKRKLAAIMFTDMVGYTALMQKDEGKVRELIERHRALMKPFVEKHGGEIIQFVGDGTFCRFDSAKQSREYWNEFITKPPDFEILERAATKSLTEGINVCQNSNSR